MNKFHFDLTSGSKEISIMYKRNFHYVAMPMMTSKILKSIDFTESKKSRFLKKETLFFFKQKNYTSRANLWQKIALQWR